MRIEQRAVVRAPAELAYRLVEDVTLWARWFEPAVHAATVGRGPGGDTVRRWALRGGDLHAWTSTRRLDPAGGWLTFDQLEPPAPLAAMGGEWRFTARADGTTLVEVSHEFRLLGGDPTQIAERTRAQSQRQLDALTAAAERWAGLDDVELARLAFPTDLPIDAVLRHTAARVPDRAAIVTPAGTVTYAELDDRVSRTAGFLTALGPQATVAVTPVLGLGFPLVLYGASRAGHTTLTVKMALTGADLAAFLTENGVRAAFLTRAQLAGLPEVPGLEAYPVDEIPAGEPTPGRGDPATVAYVHFTHGTTGAPKPIELTHRNLVANAAQTAQVHELDQLDIVLNHLPVYHNMHLNGAVWAGATQVLCVDPDPAAAIAMANAHRVRCLYAQPGQLARLAADPRLSTFHLDTVEVIRTGGTDLRPAVATALSERFGVPVIQGYGMVETAALTHSDRRARPTVGSVGPAVPGTECRIVDVDTREPLGPGTPGEVLVRGPQVAAGRVDADGWLATGDLGHVDDIGTLTLVDRLGDVFKVGNELVSPTEIERVLLDHPDVHECAVVGYPDDILGQVPYALIVQSPPDPDRLAELLESANKLLPAHQRLHSVSAVDAIPGARFGKIHRRELRDRIAPTPQGEQ
ncbi:hypothetical protein Lfu02_74730 [Longispora fulva]|uniref:Long-chain acyl-CoA synthetase n=1 Tax=Longispora fulva TaxID=619741 RepID=A0A8J7KFV7_9ACTN|nr:AMP-binding protein [Longispora fulva]MBG6134209.1 long-chain acyl-CoA synthetase [Longispora fulva]GIG63101.1 hypothetical protein Lfu02_74730 [Longispora fulva]